MIGAFIKLFPTIKWSNDFLLMDETLTGLAK